MLAAAKHEAVQQRQKNKTIMNFELMFPPFKWFHFHTVSPVFEEKGAVERTPCV